MEEKLVRDTRIFNTPLEAGLRALVILTELESLSGFDLQHIVILDYLLTHSGDVANGPASLHADIPLRASSVSVRRKLIENGLDLMVSRDLVSKNFSEEHGVTYLATPLASKFLGYFDTTYSKNLIKCGKWLKSRFGKATSSELRHFFSENLERWSSEFSKESFERFVE